MVLSLVWQTFLGAACFRHVDEHKAAVRGSAASLVHALLQVICVASRRCALGVLNMRTSCSSNLMNACTSIP
eukprot:6370989-Amphidinium_carterae.1